MISSAIWNTLEEVKFSKANKTCSSPSLKNSRVLIYYNLHEKHHVIPCFKIIHLHNSTQSVVVKRRDMFGRLPFRFLVKTLPEFGSFLSISPSVRLFGRGGGGKRGEKRKERLPVNQKLNFLH